MIGIFVERTAGGSYREYRIGGERSGKWYPPVYIQRYLTTCRYKRIFTPVPNDNLLGLWINHDIASDGDDRERVEQFMADKGGIPSYE